MSTGQSTIERKLTTILAADAAGYSNAMERDEVGTLEALRAAREVFAKFIDRHNGRIANTAGDGLLADFPSVVEAVQCAIEVQRELGQEDHRLSFRIGIHLGDVIVDGQDLLGEGVNLASRLQTMADPGSVLVSQQVYDQVRSKLTVGFEYLGERRPKNYDEDVAVYCVSFGAEQPSRSPFGRQPGNNVPKSAENPPAPSREALKRPSASETESTVDLRGRVILHAKILGVVWLGLLFINLVSSGNFWVQWPGLAMLVALGMEAAPLFATPRIRTMTVRFGVLILFLLALNLLTWSGTLWAVYPSAAMIVAAVLHRITVRA
ncbi:MAG: adenylate/guanylate cyclase domain-containing protein [Pseudomonadota bacterium]